MYIYNIYIYFLIHISIYIYVYIILYIPFAAELYPLISPQFERFSSSLTTDSMQGGAENWENHQKDPKPMVCSILCSFLN